MRLVRSQIGAAPDFRAHLVLQDYLHPRYGNETVHDYGLNVPLRAFHIDDVQAPCRKDLSGASAAGNDLIAEQRYGAAPPMRFPAKRIGSERPAR